MYDFLILLVFDSIDFIALNRAVVRVLARKVIRDVDRSTLVQKSGLDSYIPSHISYNRDLIAI